MWMINIFILVLLFGFIYGNHSEETALYYYGIEESERGLPLCGAASACAGVVRRYWRRAGLLRLCRCARRRRCDAPQPRHRRLEINNRAYLQFCQPISDWPQCAFGETSLVVQNGYDRMDPDELEQMHHNNIHLTPPNITFNCQCPTPNYWKLKSNSDDNSILQYQCGFLPLCRTDEFCGNVDNNVYALYQSCLCPKNHICVHGGGIKYTDITELLYRGKGWKAYCKKLNDDYDYDND